MPQSDLNDYERSLVKSWKDTHKKSSIMLLVLLLLSEKPGWSQSLQEDLNRISEGNLEIDNQSLHRSLRRLDNLNLVMATAEAAAGTGAKRKIYQLTKSGRRVLREHLNTTLSYQNNPDFIRLCTAVEAPQS